jgi:hypothetical protein
MKSKKDIVTEVIKFKDEGFIVVSSCVIKECCGHYFPVRILKNNKELYSFEEDDDAFELDSPLLEDLRLEGKVVKLRIEVLGDIEDFYGNKDERIKG